MNNNDYSININKNSRQANNEFSLESILAEYKSEAFIAGERRTPKTILEERSRAIVMEAISETMAASKLSSSDPFPIHKKTKNAGSRKHNLYYVNQPSRNYSGRTASSKPVFSEEEAAVYYDGISEEGYDDLSTGEYSSDSNSRGYVNSDTGSGYYDGYDIQHEYTQYVSKENGSLFSRLKDRLFAKKQLYSDDKSDQHIESTHVTYSSAEQLLDYEGVHSFQNDEEGEWEDDTGYSDEIYGEDNERGYYAGGDYPPPDESLDYEKYERFAPAKENNFLKPVISIIAAIITIRRSRKAAEAVTPPSPEKESSAEEIPEMPPGKAAKLYASQIMPLKLRCFLSAVFSAILIYISYSYDYGFPLPGALKGNTEITVALCLLLELSIIMFGLDVFTNGIMSLVRRRPGAESLAAVSCVASIIDAVFIIAFDHEAPGLPFCAVSSVSLTCALWGSRLTCTGMRASFRAASMSASPKVVSSESGVGGDDTLLMRFSRDLSGFVGRSEQADAGEGSYAVMTPFLLASALVFSILASVFRGRAGDFFHTFSAIISGCASFSALLAFPLPFSVISRKLLQSGAAIAGYPGACDIGKSQGIVVTDADLFPPTALEIETSRILEGFYSDKVISYTGSVLAASGAGISSAFTELIRKNGYTMHRVDDFTPHDGGGFIATIRGEQVFVGSSGFMNLLGIRLPRSLTAKNVVFTAISGTLVGVFSIKYSALASVQDALISLLHTKGAQYFAVRDFNITPLLIKQKFRLPAESFEFPSFSDRFGISLAAPTGENPPAALLSRDNLGAMVDAYTGGRRLYRAGRLGVLISALSSITGLILIFFLCWAGAFDSATVSNILSFMFLWLVPVLVISIGLRR